MLWTHSIWKHCPCIAFHNMLCYDFSHFLPHKKDFVMHKHITYYTQSTVCQRGFYERISSNKFLSSSPWAYAGFAKRGTTFWRAG